MSPIVNPSGGGSGGSQPISLAVVQLTSAQLISTNTTAITLLAAPGGRNYYIPHLVVMHYRFGTTPYTGAWYPTVGFGSRAALITDTDLGAAVVIQGQGYGRDFGQNVLLAQTADAYLYGWPSGGASGVWNAWLAATIENKALAITNDTTGAGTPIAAGDGTLTMRIFYSLINGAP